MKKAPHPNPSYGLTLRLHIPNVPGLLGKVASAIGKAGGSIGSVDLVSVSDGHLVRDIVVNPTRKNQDKQIFRGIRRVPGVSILNAFDRTFRMHEGGKIEVLSKVPIKTREDLSMAYTPGVGRVCMAIAENPEQTWTLTIKRNTVAVVSDGSAVLGLGNIGPKAAIPVMEGKAQLFKTFGAVDAFPICLDTQDSAEIIQTVVRIAPVFGGINLEDISAPRCFEIENKLQALLDIPVMHDDQHGTAVVVLAGLLNALRLTKRHAPDVKIVVSGVGAAGVGVVKLLMHAGVRHIIGCDRAGAIYRGRLENMNPVKEWFAEHTNQAGCKGSLRQALRKADVFLGLSGPGTVSPADIRRMAKDPIVFTMANPIPEIMPEEIPFVRVLATGRSDYPNQVNNALAFPGIFRGCLDVGATRINLPMLLAAARAIAGLIEPDKLQPDYIIPSIFNPDVAKNVSAAVSKAAMASGAVRTARKKLAPLRG